MCAMARDGEQDALLFRGCGRGYLELRRGNLGLEVGGARVGVDGEVLGVLFGYPR